MTTVIYRTVQHFDDLLTMTSIPYSGPATTLEVAMEYTNWCTDNMDLPTGTKVALNTALWNGKTVYYMTLRLPDGTVQCDIFTDDTIHLCADCVVKLYRCEEPDMGDDYFTWFQGTCDRCGFEGTVWEERD